MAQTTDAQLMDVASVYVVVRTDERLTESESIAGLQTETRIDRDFKWAFIIKHLSRVTFKR